MRDPCDIERAFAAIKARPGRSARDIAAELGVEPQQIRAALDELWCDARIDRIWHPGGTAIYYPTAWA